MMIYEQSMQYALSHLTDKERNTYHLFTNLQNNMSDRAVEFGGLEAFFSEKELESYYAILKKIEGLRRLYTGLPEEDRPTYTPQSLQQRLQQTL